MSGLIGDLIEGIASFFADVWVARRQRAARGRPANDWGTDARAMVVLDVWAMVVSALACAAFAVMFFGLELPLWISLLPVVAGAVYIGYRWYAMIRA